MLYRILIDTGEIFDILELSLSESIALKKQCPQFTLEPAEKEDFFDLDEDFDDGEDF